MIKLILASKSMEGIKKNSSNREVKNRAKMPLKIMKMENIVENWAKNVSKNHEN
jgi:hypothetical protein